MKGIAKDYFLELFQRKDGDRVRVINAVPQSISTQDNDILTRPFSVDEFREAAFSMGNDKCPGPDGFNPGFFKSFWSSCGTDIF